MPSTLLCTVAGGGGGWKPMCRGRPAILRKETTPARGHTRPEAAARGTDLGLCLSAQKPLLRQDCLGPPGRRLRAVLYSAWDCLKWNKIFICGWGFVEDF